MTGALLEGTGIVVRRKERITLGPVDLGLSAGETVGVYGPNGSGKSTLLQALANLLPLAQGRVAFGGKVVGHDLDSLSYHRRIGAVFQEPLLLRGTVEHNVGLGLALRGMPSPERAARVRAALDRLKIAHLADRNVARLSGGEAQRTSLARALVLEPEVLFLDEPFSALDQPTRRHLVKELASVLGERRMTTLFITHDFAEAVALCDRCIILDAGQALQIDAPARLLERPASARVAEILGL